MRRNELSWKLNWLQNLGSEDPSQPRSLYLDNPLSLLILKLRLWSAQCCFELHHGTVLGGEFWPSLLHNLFIATVYQHSLIMLCNASKQRPSLKAQSQNEQSRILVHVCKRANFARKESNKQSERLMFCDPNTLTERKQIFCPIFLYFPFSTVSNYHFKIKW